jgi:hypothetical protein
VHRLTLYLALAILVILAYDVIRACFWGPDNRFGIHVGTLVLLLNVILLGGYTFGCHSLRHLVGGGIDLLSRRPVRAKAYDCVSCLNRRHMLWAWMSLFWVGFSDVYVFMCSAGVWTDYRIIGA